MIDKEALLKEFPEARESDSSGHLEYYVHCRQPHKKGGIYKMSVNSETGVYYCHDCGATGNVENDYLDVINQFKKRDDVYRGDIESKPAYKRNLKEWKDGIPTPGNLIKITDLNEDHPAAVYIKNRGISNELADIYGLMYCDVGQYKFSGGLGTTSGRVIFPVYMGGKLRGWQARVVDTTTVRGRRAVWHGEKQGWIYPIKNEDESWSDYGVPKYYTCPGMKRYEALFGFDRAVLHGQDTVVVVEGPVDCLKVGQKCVSTLGSKITNQQIRFIVEHWDNIIWILDRDIDTESKWFKGVEAELSKDSKSLCWFKMDTAKDPGEMSSEDIWKEINIKCGEQQN